MAITKNTNLVKAKNSQGRVQWINH